MNGTAIWRELHRISDQIRERLPQPIAIAKKRRDVFGGAAGDGDASRPANGLKHSNDLVDDLHDVAPTLRDRQRPRFQTRHVEQKTNRSSHGLPRVLEHMELRVQCSLGFVTYHLEKELGAPADRHERNAQVMRVACYDGRPWP